MKTAVGALSGAAFSVALVGVVAASNGGCDNLTVHAFVGQLYDPVNQCLKGKSVIDVIRGEAKGTCTGVRCFVDTAGDAFISTTCEAPPGFEDHSTDAHDRQCALALEVFDEGADGNCPDLADAGP